MKGVVIPPSEEDYTADPVELFFDLAFVFAFSRLVSHLVHHPDWAGLGEFALLFWMIWMAWSQFTWSANAVPGNLRPVRLLFLVGTIASVPMAASVTTAYGDGGPSFAIPVGVILSLGLFTMIAALPADHAARAAIIRYSVPNFVAIAFMVVGSFLDREIRIGCWLAAVAIIVVGTLRAGDDEWLIRPGHFAERHGLIVIVALGEVIVALGVPVVDALEEGEGLPGRTAVAMIAAGVFACLLWWAYFDRVNRALEHRHEEQPSGTDQGRYARDVYTYGHLPIAAGVILAAAALEEIALHPADELPLAFRWMMFAGLGLFMLGVALSVWRAFGVVAKERLVAGAVVALLAAVGGSMSGLLLLVLVDVVLAVALALEHVRIERPSDRTVATRTAG